MTEEREREMEESGEENAARSGCSGEVSSGPFGPVWLAFAGYRYWRRLPAKRKAELKKQARAFATRIRVWGARTISNLEVRLDELAYAACGDR
jgi:hypothetical protein